MVLRLATIVRRAFMLYNTGRYSDSDVAVWMNQRPVIQKLRMGKQPIGKETVRDMLQNRVYTGRVPYAETHYSGSLGQGKQSSRGRRQWFEGKHQGFVSDELFDRCQEVREIMSRTRKAPALLRTYLLHDRLFCLRCMCTKPTDLTHECYGKMRPSFDQRRQSAWYRCYARDRGYQACGQSYTNERVVNDQVIDALTYLPIPDGFQARIECVLKAKAEHTERFERIAELQEVVHRLNFSWEQGCLGITAYLDRRHQLDQEIISLRSLAYDIVVEAEDLLRHFAKHWEACTQEERPEVARKQLLAKIIDKVFVYDQIVVGISLHDDYGLILATADLTLSELVAAVRDQKTSTCSQTRGKQGNRAGTKPPVGWATPFIWAHQFDSYQPILNELLPA